MKFKDIKDKLANMNEQDRDLLFVGVYAIIAMITHATHAPEWVVYSLMFLGGLYIVFTSPKIEDKEKKQDSVLEQALKETSAQLKGVEALDEHFKKHPYKMPKKLKSRKRKR